MSSVAVEKGTVPTPETKIVLAGKVPTPPLWVGVWAWGDSSTWNSGGWTSELEAEAKTAFDKCLETGVVALDTAEIYGRGESERVCGRFLSTLTEEQKAKVVLATKFIPFPWKFSYPSSLINALKASLDRLGLKKVQLYQIHGPIHLRAIETVADALAEAVKLGLAETVGVSNYSIDEVARMHKRLKEHGIQLASNQVEFSLLRKVPETSGLIKTCHELGIAVLGYSPLGQGRLTGKYSASSPPPSGRKFSDYPMAQIEPLLAAMKKISESHSVPVSAVALNWVICKGVIPLAGAKNGKQAEANSKAMGWRLSEEEVKELDGLAIEGANTWTWQHG